MKNSIELSLLGQKILLKSSEDPTLVGEVVELVSRKIRDAEARASNVAPHYIALLALLDLGEQYVRAKHRLEERRKAFDQKTEELLSLVQAESAQ